MGLVDVIKNSLSRSRQYDGFPSQSQNLLTVNTPCPLSGKKAGQRVETAISIPHVLSVFFLEFGMIKAAKLIELEQSEHSEQNCLGNRLVGTSTRCTSVGRYGCRHPEL